MQAFKCRPQKPLIHNKINFSFAGVPISGFPLQDAALQRHSGISGNNAGQRADHLPPVGADHNVHPVSPWTKNKGYLPSRIPRWNPMLVKLMKRYLSSQRTTLPIKNSESFGIFLKAFNQMSERTRSKRKRDGPFVWKTMKNDKIMKLKQAKIKSDLVSAKHTAGRIRRYAFQSNDGMSINNHYETVDDPFDANDHLVKWEHNSWLYPNQQTNDNHQYQRDNFLIPLEGPSRLKSGKQTVVRSDSYGFSGDVFTDNYYKRRRKKRSGYYDDDFNKDYYGRRDGRYSSYPKYKDPFHPLAEPLKDSSYRHDDQSRKSVLYPYDFTDFYEDPFFKKKSNKRRGGSTRRKDKPKGKNFHFYDSFYSQATSKKPNFFIPDYNDDRVTYPNVGGYDHSKGYDTKFGYSKLGYDENVQDLDYNKLDFLPSIGNGGYVVRGRSAGTSGSDAVGVAPAIDATAVSPAVDATVAEPVDTEQFLPTTQAATLTSATQRAALSTSPVVVVTSPSFTPITTRIVPRTANPCDGLFITSTSLPLTTTRRPCYYLPRTTPPTTPRTTPRTTLAPTTTPCLVTHYPGQVNPHYHSVTSQPPHESTQPTYQPTQPESIWSEFEILSSSNLWDTHSPRPTITRSPPSRDTSTRHFMITPEPGRSRFITNAPPHYANPNQNIKQTQHLDTHLYLPAKNKMPRITGTIELKYNKDKKPSFIVKLPFKTGTLPFTIRRLILSRFTEWPRKGGARNIAPVTMDPTCSPWNASCARPAALSPGQQVVAEGENGLDIIAEVDPSLFDGQRLRQALLEASSRVKDPLDQEEMDPPRRKSADILGALGGAEGDANDMARPGARFLDWTAPPGGKSQDGANPQNHVEQGDTEWLELMSPSTANPWADSGPLPAETPLWLQDVIKRFTKSGSWRNGHGNNEGGDEEAVGRLLPSQEPYELDNHIDLFPRAQTLKAYSGTGRTGSAGTVRLFLLATLTFILYAMQ